MKHVRKTKIFLITALFIFLFIATKYILDINSEHKREYYLNVQTTLLQTKYKTSYRYFKIMTSDIYAMYSQNKKLITFLTQTNHASKDELQKIRSSVYTLLQKNYKRLNHMGISQVHFYLPNNTSFLRMYKPEAFGDDVSSIKKSVVLTNIQHTFHEGFEACNYMIGLRFVYPLYDYKKHFIGSVEISYSTQQLLKSITDDFVYDSHILVSKSLTNGTVIEKRLENIYKDTWETDEYYIEESTHKSVGTINFFETLNTPELRIAIKSGITSQLPFSKIAQYNYKYITLSFLPMADVSGHKNIAYIVTYTESDYLNNIEIENDYISLLIVIVLALLYLFTLYVIANQEHFKKLALYDNLTKLPNRALFQVNLEHGINRALRENSKIALMFIDLDGFKSVNDTYGHQEGDELLITVANRITQVLRKTDLVARIGGDEFTVILSDIKKSKEALDIANNIIQSISKEILINNHIPLCIGASIGVALYPDHTKKATELIKYADQMMYISKKSGKNRVTLYNKKEKNNV